VVGGLCSVFGDWRPVTDAGKRNFSIKLLHCSKNPAAGLDDEENLKTGYKEDEEVILMPVSWVKAGTFICDLYSPLVLDGNQTIKGKSKFTPQTLWKCAAQDLEKKFGVAAKNVGGNPMKVVSPFSQL
jgi:hypothetical protein